MQKRGSVPWPHTETFKALARGEVDAIFDEAASSWVPQARSMPVSRFLRLRRADRAKARSRRVSPRRAAALCLFRSMPDDVLSLDFSGWTVFVHEAADAALVTAICAALEARKARIPWEEPGDLPVERMAREALDTPQTVPLHPAAGDFGKAAALVRTERRRFNAAAGNQEPCR